MLENSNLLSGMLRRPLITVDATTTVFEALAIARVWQVNHLPVVRGWRLVGLVCTCGLRNVGAETRVDTVMSQPPVTLDVAASVLDAARAMQDRDVGSVIVTEHGQPAGIITRGDLLLCNPEVKVALTKQRCECCGLTRHLLTDAAGHTLCAYCFEHAGEAAAIELL